MSSDSSRAVPLTRRVTVAAIGCMLPWAACWAQATDGAAIAVAETAPAFSRLRRVILIDSEFSKAAPSLIRAAGRAAIRRDCQQAAFLKDAHSGPAGPIRPGGRGADKLCSCLKQPRLVLHTP
ncbi:hypothetical protein G6F57_022935 [Rhizopus arrhizus]|nr:hypothetical protein G6F57_022935 [Rhizopus arrhizus]